MKATRIRLKWAGGLHWFSLDLVQPGGWSLLPSLTLHDRERAILGRLVGGTWGSQDIANTIRLGLVGGGDFKPNTKSLLEPWAAVDALVNQHVLRRPLAESLALAQTILLATIVGVDPDLADRGLDPVKVGLEDLVGALAEA